MASIDLGEFRYYIIQTKIRSRVSYNCVLVSKINERIKFKKKKVGYSYLVQDWAA